eukprot:16174613-Heterocapsa_arctica.AAC.1
MVLDCLFGRSPSFGVSGLSGRNDAQPAALRKPAELSSTSARHWDGCAARAMQGCSECKYISLKQRWAAVLPIDTEKPDLGTWLVSKRTGGKFGVGCAVCAMAKTGTTASLLAWGTLGMMQVINFQRHAATPTHQKVVAKLTGKPCVLEKDCNAPSEEDFRKVLEKTKAGNAVRHSLEGIGGRQKQRKLQLILLGRSLQRRGQKVLAAG